ncbi:MAG: nitroreductase family protein [Actinobacteria bacterium]|nr:nitroreductase family protein [Actinomycetota bacterium]
MRKRRSVRAFLNEDVPLETILEILEEAILAPSAGNLQPWRFIVIGNQELKFQLTQSAFAQRFIAQAPWVVAVVAKVDESAAVYGERGKNLYAIQDTAALIMLILLSATNRDLGACWVGAFDDDKVSEILGVKPGERVVALVPIGKPARTPEVPSSRKELSEIIEIIE